jgi:hypothetical protein
LFCIISLFLPFPSLLLFFFLFFLPLDTLLIFKNCRVYLVFFFMLVDFLLCRYDVENIVLPGLLLFNAEIDKLLLHRNSI